VPDLSADIDRFLTRPPYEPEHDAELLALLRQQVLAVTEADAGYANYVRHWPVPPRHANCLADLPYLSVSVFKRQPPFALVPQEQIARVLTSSSTTGQEPSRIPLDGPTSRRMTKALAAILKDFIGPDRRPYLVIDDPGATAAGPSLGARGTAIRGLSPFATETAYCLKADGTIDHTTLDSFVASRAAGSVLAYGFTYLLWRNFVRPLREAGVCLNLTRAHVLHSGGWKRLQDEAVSKDEFNAGVAAVFGCPVENVIDFYGMVENVGVVYPDCRAGNKHAPNFGAVIVRDPLTLRPAAVGATGLVQVCSILPTSFPGHLLLTEDMATVVLDDGCPCGRPGLAFRFAGRAPKSEPRGCGDVRARRQEAA
jgi:hypothetical protein